MIAPGLCTTHESLSVDGGKPAEVSISYAVELSVCLLDSPQRFGSFIENVQIAAINEEAMPFASSGLFEDAEVDHVAQRLRDRWCGDANPLCGRWYGNDRVSLYVLEHAQYRGCGSAERIDLLLIVLEKVQYLACGAGGLVGGVAHANQEEIEPGFPIALGSHPVEQFVVRGSIGFEIQTEVEDRLS